MGRAAAWVEVVGKQGSQRAATTGQIVEAPWALMCVALNRKGWQVAVVPSADLAERVWPQSRWRALLPEVYPPRAFLGRVYVQLQNLASLCFGSAHLISQTFKTDFVQPQVVQSDGLTRQPGYRAAELCLQFFRVVKFALFAPSLRCSEAV